MFSENCRSMAFNPFAGLIEQVNKDPFIRPYESDKVQLVFWRAMLRADGEMTVADLVGQQPIDEHVARASMKVLLRDGVFAYGSKRGWYVKGPNFEACAEIGLMTERGLKKHKMLEFLKKAQAEGTGPVLTAELAQVIGCTVNKTSRILYEMRTEDGTVTNTTVGKQAFWTLSQA